MTALLIALAALLGLAIVALASSARIIHQYERGVVFRFGRVLRPPRQPGLNLIIPGVDHLRHVSV